LSGFNFFTFAGEFPTAINYWLRTTRSTCCQPSIMTAENKKAVINVSRSVPIVTSPAELGGTRPTGWDGRPRS
jgi:hypothetical protein